jgi:nucleotide-binding universal stress UspA family protein
MTKLFNNILVPVDFSDACELAIEKAIDIANHFRCNIHLMFAEREGLFGGKQTFLTRSLSGDISDPEARLYYLQNKYTYQLDAHLLIHSCVRRGNMNRSVTEYALRHGIDLVIVGKSHSNGFIWFTPTFDVNIITNRLECPVLCVQTFVGNERWNNIVLPVSSVLPIRKIMFASYLARKYNSSIHLLGVTSDDDHKNADDHQYLHKAFQLLRDNTRLNIECHTIRGRNIAEATLRFAQKINADLIVVNPGRESRLSGFLNKVFKGSLFSESRIPVMTISAG